MLEPDAFSIQLKSLLTRHADERTFSLKLDGKKHWVKQAAPGEANVWHKVLRVLSMIFRNPLFTPTVVTNPRASLAHEADKLTRLHALGVPVPKVILRQPDYLLLEDAGAPLGELLNDPRIEQEEKKTIIRQAARTLANLHNAGEHHSRPVLRDMAYKNGQVYFMDFEENLTGVLNERQAIVRDGLIFVSALYRKLPDAELVEQGLQSYRQTLRAKLWQTLTRKGRRFRITFYLLYALRPILGKDGWALYRALRYFRAEK